MLWYFMKRVYILKKYKCILIIVIIILGILIIYPNIEFRKNNKLYVFSYSENLLEWEDNMCYQERYSYNEKRNISVYQWNIKKFLIFKILILDYKNGNLCDSEYLLEESYIKDFINKAKIIENEDNIDIEKLIQNKTPVVGNKRYFTDGDKYQIFFELNGEEEEMFVFYNNDLLIIQVGLGDEGAKYIAYK